MKLPLLIRFWFPVMIWAGIIFLFSSFSTPKTSQVYWQDFLLKKTIHFLEYGIFFLLWFRGFKNTTSFSRKQIIGWSFVLVVLYALTDEFHQTFVFGREGTFKDVMIDGLGAFAAWIAIWKYLPKAPAKLKSWAKNWQLV